MPTTTYEASQNTLCKAVVLVRINSKTYYKDCSAKVDPKGDDYCLHHTETLRMGVMYDRSGLRVMPRIRRG